MVVTVALAGLAGLPTPAAAAPAAPSLWNQASASGWPVGVAIFDSVTLGGGANPTGTLTFSLYGPHDPSCSGAPLFTSFRSVNGNGYYASAYYVTLLAGTYRWTAAYSGDANNAAAGPTPCGLSSAAVTVAKRSPGFKGSANLIGGALTATATLNGANPTGNVTFRLYGPNNLTCAGAPVFSATVPVSGNGTYSSPPFRPTALGTYQWVLNYSGDANNLWAGTTCSDPANASAVAILPTLSVSAAPASVRVGGEVTVSWTAIAHPETLDWVGIYRVDKPDWDPIIWKFIWGVGTGSMVIPIPDGSPAGTYEIRLFANNTFQRMATSAPFTITA